MKRRLRTRALVAVSALAGALVLAAMTSAACSSQETEEAPDAAKPPCNQGPFLFFCDPKPGQPTCSASSGGAPALARLPPGTEVPVGCVVNLVGTRDDQGDCPLEAVCKCLLAEGPPDAGGDGGSAGPAAAWLCAP